MLENPFSLHFATGKNFIGRTDSLAVWRERLTLDSEPWQSAKSWMVIGAGGMGKTSLLYELIRIAKDEVKAHIVSIDLGRLREMGDKVVEPAKLVLMAPNPVPIKCGRVPRSTEV